MSDPTLPGPPADRKPRRLFAAALTLVLAACASDYGTRDLRAGLDEAGVVQQMGTPTARYPGPDGSTRLVFARGPAGKETYLVDLGADGRVKAWKQALGREQFQSLRIGMTAQQVLFDFGPPGERRPYRISGGEIWSYRFPTYQCEWFQIEFNANQRITVMSYEPDPKCASWTM